MCDCVLTTSTAPRNESRHRHSEQTCSFKEHSNAVYLRLYAYVDASYVVKFLAHFIFLRYLNMANVH